MDKTMNEESKGKETKAKENEVTPPFIAGEKAETEPNPALRHLESERDVPFDDSDHESQYPWQNDESYPSLGDTLEDGAKFTSGSVLEAGIEVASKETVIAALQEVYDPEIPVNIYELGLIYDVEIGEKGATKIVMTLTTPNCPVAGTLPQMVADQAASCVGVGEVDVTLTWEPPWEASRMSEDARLALGFFD